MSTLSDQFSIPLLAGGWQQNRLLCQLFASSVRRLGFSMLGELGNKRSKTDAMLPKNVVSNLAIARYGYRPRSSWT